MLAKDVDEVVARAAAAWETLRGSRIFITGGTGFFGCWMLETLVGANERLGLNASATVLTRDPAAFDRKAPHLARNPAIRLMAGDVRTLEAGDERYSHVLHLATDTDARRYEQDPLAMLDTIVEGTRRVLDFAVACEAENFLLASSGAVYGRQPNGVAQIPEEYGGGPDPTDPKWTYGEGKRVAEMLGCLYAKQHGLRVKIARCFAFTGPYLPLDQHFAIGNFIADVLEGRPIVIRGDGTPLRSYLYAADLAAWLWTMLVKAEAGRAYNTGSSEAISIAELACLVQRALGKTTEIRILGEVVPGRPAERYVPSVERAQRELGLSAWTSLEEGIRRTAAWHDTKR